MGDKTRILELFAGIGGAARAFEQRGDIVAAIDINQKAQAVYGLNFEHVYHVKSIQDVTPGLVQGLEAELWWVSAPCQPYTRRGNQLDSEDRRSAGLKHVIKLLQVSPPDHLFLENVIGFESSKSRNELIRVLSKTRHNICELKICPTQLGIPNRRPRYYLVASRKLDFQWRSGVHQRKRIVDFLDQGENEHLSLNRQSYSQHEAGLNVVDSLSYSSNCFTSAYGKSITKSGSYLKSGNGIRRFSPTEIARMLGFFGQDLNGSFQFPEHFTVRNRWKLLGNSISIFVVQEIIKQFFAQWQADC